ncbi:2-amino-4-hydroxy-6-hydroxymethyldihydropteridine diphosphokinase [Bacillus sp. 2205SS5-2]|uniref:2-amino-4-hydroxy-6- hydroxymethyldihydropteridine diphosphokinase n=1 Tax=Bacillus sp. 2205SS5-2 TaxID=3109031 RepID=UPI0030066BD6
MTTIAYISLGANVGDREYFLWCGIKALHSHEKVQVVQTSSIYETDPVGYTEQGKFLNMVVKVETLLAAEELLQYSLFIEKDLGRERIIKWGPRTIDLDILLYNQDNMKTENLIVPHPRMHERAFVLIPLLEIDSDLAFPTMDTSLKEHLNEIPDKEGVRLWKQINGEDAYVPLGS